MKTNINSVNTNQESTMGCAGTLPQHGQALSL